MPYIPEVEREQLRNNEIAFEDLSLGQCNYLITKFVDGWIGKPSYTRIASMVGVLETVKLELYRRVAVPYENTKCSENGDVYGIYERDLGQEAAIEQSEAAVSDAKED